MQENNENIAISARLKLLISTLGLTQVAFANKLGISKSAISQYISGVRPITENLVYRVTVEVPNVNAEWLKSGEGPMLKYDFDLPEGAEPPTLEELELRAVVERLKKENARLYEAWMHEKDINDELKKKIKK